LPCGTGTGTVTCKKVGTGTVINYGYVITVLKWVSQRFSQTHSIKLCISFPSFNIFSFTFYDKFDETYINFFLVNKLRM
jgi:hypothetical protein